MKSAFSALALTPLVFAATSGVAQGQTASAAAVEDSPRAILEPATLGENEGATLNLTVRTAYHSNITRASDTALARSGLHKSDLLTTPAANLIFLRHFGANFAVLNATLGYDFHAHNTILDRERINSAARVYVNLTTFAVDLDAFYNRGQTNLANFTTLDPASSNRNTETARGVNATFRLGNGIVGLQPYGRVGYRATSNSNPFRRRFDHDQYEYAAGLALISPPIGKITAFARRYGTRYSQQILADGRENGFDRSGVGVSFARRSGARLKVSAELSYEHVDARSPTAPDYKGLNWIANATLVPQDRLQLSLETSRQAVATNNANTSYYLETGYAGNASYAASPRLQLDVGWSRSDRRYPGLPSGPLTLTDDRRDTYGLRAGYTGSPRIRLTFGGSVERRTADNPLFNYTDYVGEAGISFTY